MATETTTARYELQPIGCGIVCGVSEREQLLAECRDVLMSALGYIGTHAPSLEVQAAISRLLARMEGG